MNSDLPPTLASFERHSLAMSRASAWSRKVASGNRSAPWGPGDDEPLAHAALETNLILGQRHGWKCLTHRHTGGPRPLGPLAAPWRAWRGIESFALVLRPEGTWCGSNPNFWDEREPVRLHHGDVIQWWLDQPKEEGGHQAMAVVTALLLGQGSPEEAVDLAFRQKYRQVGGDPISPMGDVAPAPGSVALSYKLGREGLPGERAVALDRLFHRLGKKSGWKIVCGCGSLAIPFLAPWVRWWAPVSGDALTFHFGNMGDLGYLRLGQVVQSVLDGTDDGGTFQP